MTACFALQTWCKLQNGWEQGWPEAKKERNRKSVRLLRAV